jgi:hypothetical protein
MLNFSKFAVLGAVLAASVPFASATPIPITAQTSVTTYTAGASSAPTGSTVFNSGTLSVNAPTFNATYTETIVADTSNIFCSGCLTYVFQFSNLAPVVSTQHPNGNSIEHFTVGAFTGFATAVGYEGTTGTTNPGSTTDSAPITVDESLDSVLSFNFTSALITPVIGIQPNVTSDIFFVDTNSTSFQAGNGGLIDSSSMNIFPDVPAGTPTALTPEPSSLMFLGTGLISAAGMLVRRRRVA